MIHQECSVTEVTVADIWVRAGAMIEPIEWPGMAHFLEHMIFKGTEKLAPGEFDWLVENRGGTSNAATSYDYAHYFITTASQHLPETLPYLADLVLQASIPDAEFERERDVVLEEIRQSQDDPDSVGFQILMETVYQQHPYGRSVLGTEVGLMRHSPDTMRIFHRAHYQPNNMALVIVGDISQDAALELADRSFQFLPPAPCPLPEVEAEPPITRIRQEEVYLPRLEEARLMMAWIGPGIEQSFQEEHLRWACGLDVISALLTEGRTSRLVRELREERHLVHHITSSFSLQRDSSLFTIMVWLQPEDIDRVQAIICDRLTQLTSQPITPSELERCKRLIRNDFVFSTEMPAQLAGLYGYYNTIARPEMAVSYPEIVHSLHPEELQHLASRYLSPYHYAAVMMKPM
ncbi:pitrilysin family protein [Leptolyngbya sp. 'hensonii']|uniref:M16 family metallopeptidase n=1 Tax=Leptolyngbya sp. 'hensonii' TaxID=1922337 RepID=UPI00209B700B|nr:pitrilysin family protein [Leptolyngbya sp. 'hensonii']